MPRVILYLDQHEALTAARDFQNTLSTQTPFFVTSIVVTLAAWGSLLATDRHPPDLLELIALTIEAYEALNAEPDSLGKFLVCHCFAQNMLNPGSQLIIDTGYGRSCRGFSVILRNIANLVI